jgi:hypothetical protein
MGGKKGRPGLKILALPTGNAPQTSVAPGRSPVHGVGASGGEGSGAGGSNGVGVVGVTLSTGADRGSDMLALPGGFTASLRGAAAAVTPKRLAGLSALGNSAFSTLSGVCLWGSCCGQVCFCACVCM